MPVSPEDQHQSIVNHSRVSIAWVGTNAAHSQFALLAQLHVQAEGVMRGSTEPKVVLLALQLCHEVEAGVGRGD